MAMRVLIAEDELILAYAMRGQLEQRGVEVVGFATNGKTVLDHCLAHRPDVILMDVRMPEVDGIEGTRLIMEHCPTCVIIITAFADAQTRARAEAAGAMGFLSKPIQAGGVLEEAPRARARYAEFQALRAEVGDLQEALAEWVRRGGIGDRKAESRE
jgi:AmiR/NasT family two-component response regulator